MGLPLIGCKERDGVFSAKFSRSLTPEEKTIYTEIVEKFNKGHYTYRSNREYPSIGEQLDMLWHDIDDGKLGEAAKTGSFYLNIKTIKDSYPKG